MSKENRGWSRSGADDLVRRQIIASFHDENVHGGFERVFGGVPAKLRGEKPASQPFTMWRLLEHFRLCVQDFLDCCRVPDYVEPPFPDGFWPAGDAPPVEAAWDESVARTRQAMTELEALILNSATDLYQLIPGSNGRTVLRQALACLDHNAYHLGQAMLLRRMLGLEVH